MSRLVRRPRVDHAAVAARARSKPHTWLVVGEYRSGQSAEGIVRDIHTAGSRLGQVSEYRPAGAFQAVKRLTEYGCEVLVRYVVGDPR
ncbi:hypothetical protein C9F11_37650 [Streptomyces sp. YIM 121038]|uniref:hypothetical protein n=1 Tax=Streptomyces sp. YIM 121038 TaxID=2136401 RepID=UPI0011104F6A|nr:hypothetical protein [Streptomyces sp. YIM 121038]QCX81113.1 hypothetical protein C9F11_37650 [Streptomyces sp. YIM 121038]